MKGVSRRQFLGMSGAALGAMLTARFPTLARAQGLTFQGTGEFWDWEFAARGEYFAQLIGEWQALNPGITLNYTAFPWSDLGTKLLTANEAEQNPPISNVHNAWRPSLQKSGLLVPYPEDLFDYSQLASTNALRSMDGNIYTNVFCYYCDLVFLNTGMLSEAGMTTADVPATWPEFVEFAKSMTRYDANGNVERPGIGLNHYYSQQWLWQTMVYQLGGYLYNEDGTQAMWNSEQGVEALNFIRDWYHTHKIDDPLLERHFDMFLTDRAAGFISQGYWSGDLSADPLWEGRWDTAPTPTFSGTGLPAWGMLSPEEGLAVFSNYPEEVQQAMFSFISYALGTDERRIQWAKVHAGPTDRLDLLNDPAFAEGDEGNVLRNQAITIPYRIDPGEQPLEAETYWREMFERVIVNAEEAQPVLDDINARFNEVMTASGQTYLITERSYVAPAMDAEATPSA